MISKFLLAENPMDDKSEKEYILHTDAPRFLAEITETRIGYNFTIVQEYDHCSDEDFEVLKVELNDWWQDYLDWEEGIAEDEENALKN
jgi:hypothetical protein